jgi:hypothetical protein
VNDWQEYDRKQQEERAARETWLAQLKVGDEVAVGTGRSWGRRAGVPEIRKVVSVTPTLIRVDAIRTPNEYRRKDGGKRGGPYGQQINPVTNEIRERVRLHSALDVVEQLFERAQRLGFKGMTAEQAEKLAELLNVQAGKGSES